MIALTVENHVCTFLDKYGTSRDYHKKKKDTKIGNEKRHIWRESRGKRKEFKIVALSMYYILLNISNSLGF